MEFNAFRLICVLIAIASQFTLLGAQEYINHARGRRRNNNNGPPVAMMAGIGFLGAGVGFFIGRSGQKGKYNKDVKDLLTFIEQQKKLYALKEKQWQQEYKKLYDQYSALEKDSVERDYEEFKAPDTNNDDMISRQEFTTYVTKYLQSFPELSEKDFPKFDDFDLDADGLVSFDEWQQFLYQQKQEEARKKKADPKYNNNQYEDLINALYDSSSRADGFDSAQKNMASSNSKTKQAAVNRRH